MLMIHMKVFSFPEAYLIFKGSDFSVKRSSNNIDEIIQKERLEENE